MKLFVKCELSKKSGNKYFALIADLGYRQVPINFDMNLCSEFSGVPIKDMYALEAGDVLEVVL